MFDDVDSLHLLFLTSIILHIRTVAILLTHFVVSFQNLASQTWRATFYFSTFL